jgi:hypothetical protein
MLRRILATLQPVRAGTSPKLERMPCIRSVERDGIRVRVFRFERKDGHFEYWFAVEQSTDKKQTWLRLTALPDGQMQTIIDLLQQALDSLDRGWRQLRSIKLRDKTYFVDERLMQLRNVSDPEDFIDLPRPY